MGGAFGVAREHAATAGLLLAVGGGDAGDGVGAAAGEEAAAGALGFVGVMGDVVGLAGAAGDVVGVATAVVAGVGGFWGRGGGGFWFGFVTEERHGVGLEGGFQVPVV